MPIIGAIIQARTGSRRLPGKTLKAILGRPLIEYVWNQVQAARELHRVVLATSDQRQDTPLAEWAESQQWDVFRGSEQDVLDRFYRAAARYRLDAVVRITGDCPLKDPDLIDWVVSEFRQHPDSDYLATHLEPRLPQGMDIDMFTMPALRDAWKNAHLPSEREHVTPFFRKHPERFRHRSLVYDRDLTRYRLTVDEAVDFALVRSIIETLYTPGRPLHLQQVVEFLEHHPELARTNTGLIRDEAYIESLKTDLEALELCIPRGHEAIDWRTHLARAISDWMGQTVEPSQIVPGESPGTETLGFDLILRGSILDTAEVSEVRVALRARIETALTGDRPGKVSSTA